jgi:FlaA1/EpsC-like NDP-sugar epimerase
VTAWIPRPSWTPRGRHLFVFDVAAVLMAILVAFGLRFDANDVLVYIRTYNPVVWLPLLVMPPVFIVFGLYRREWRFASVNELVAISGAVLVGTGLVFVAELILAVVDFPGADGFPRSVPVIEALILMALVGGSRFAIRAGSERSARGDEDDGEARLASIVYGAGEVGAAVTRVIDRDAGTGRRVVGFVDDDPDKLGRIVLGRRVYGSLTDLPAAVEKTGARELIVAIADAPGATVRAAFEAARALHLEVRTVPRPRELLGSGGGLGLRTVSVEDLLRRAPVEVDLDAVAGYISGASVLVTGGGGSIGSELVRQIIGLGPRLLTVVDNHEEALWSIESELADRATVGQLVGRLVDVRSQEAMERVIREADPEVVFHAAALKHVPIVEAEPSEGSLTNVVGTRNTLRACEKVGVERFVLISTDKAVDPVSAMGLTKRLAELLTVAAAQRTGRPYVAVRFGNVLGSSGSVVPTFQRQLAEHRPITITHPDATRYFMTIPEAVSLILEAAAEPRSGDIYVLDMGDPIRIVDLARDLIRLSGLEPDDVPIVYTGLRAGERLHETLLHDDETVEGTEHAGILRARTGAAPDAARLDAFVDALAAAAWIRDDRAVRDSLRHVVELDGDVPTRRPRPRSIRAAS